MKRNRPQTVALYLCAHGSPSSRIFEYQSEEERFCRPTVRSQCQYTILIAVKVVVICYIKKDFQHWYDAALSAASSEYPQSTASKHQNTIENARKKAFKQTWSKTQICDLQTVSSSLSRTISSSLGSYQYVRT
jgi:hypothetical protein